MSEIETQILLVPISKFAQKISYKNYYNCFLKESKDGFDPCWDTHKIFRINSDKPCLNVTNNSVVIFISNIGESEQKFTVWKIQGLHHCTYRNSLWIPDEIVTKNKTRQLISCNKTKLSEFDMPLLEFLTIVRNKDKTLTQQKKLCGTVLRYISKSDLETLINR